MPGPQLALNAGDTLTLVVHNLRLVVSIAYQYRQAWTNILDLFQEGSVGLLEAVKRTVPSTSEWFATARNYVLYANEGGLYDPVRPFLNRR